MTYYRVKNEFDNRRRWKYARRGGLEIDGIYIGGELFTPAEYRKECRTHLIGADIFETVDLSRKNTYWSFGARFAAE